LERILIKRSVGRLFAPDPHQFAQTDVERLTDIVEPGQRQLLPRII
jgi:hypothetical protein